jgi:hypothetical protein
MLEPMVAGAVKTILASEVDPVKKQVAEFHETAKAQRIDTAIRTGLEEGRILPWELDTTAGLPTLRERLMKCDDKTPVHEFAERGAKRKITDLDAELVVLQRRPKLATSAGFKDPNDPQAKNFAEREEQEDMAKIKTFAETHPNEMALFGLTPQSMQDVFKKATPEQRKELLAAWQAAA